MILYWILSVIFILSAPLNLTINLLQLCRVSWKQSYGQENSKTDVKLCIYLVILFSTRFLFFLFYFNFSPLL